jgi:4-amino-4-deoxy-L-arabinose transferase-like glycosyltransferase
VLHPERIGFGARDSRAVRDRLRQVSRETWALVAIVVVGTALRAWWVAYAARPLGYPLGGDPLGYILRAGDLAHGRGYVSFLTGRPTAYQPPGWPMFLAGWYWIANHTPLPDNQWKMAGALNVLLAAASMCLLFAIGRRLFNARVGLIATAVYALWPNLIYYTGAAALETFFIFLVLLVMWLLLHYGWPHAEKVPWIAFVLAGLATGEMLLVRPFGVVVILAMLVAGIIAGRGWRRACKEFAVMTGVAVLVLVPWTIRNERDLHGFVPVATNLGETFCIGHQPKASGGFEDDSRYCVGPYGFNHIVQPHDELLRNNYTLHRGLSYAIHHPVAEAHLLFWRGYYLLQNDHDGIDAVTAGNSNAFIGPRVRNVLGTLGDAYFFAVALLAVFSLPQFFGRRRGGRLFVVLIGAGLFVIPLELYGLPRFKVPLAPFLALGAAVTIVRIVTGTTVEEPGVPPAVVSVVAAEPEAEPVSS